ncbi:tetratricopeptide repeat protein [Altericista sp. CCNU0014]|uniref:tetratricopeptide repeat protein n=1 Tax=Altericista sp. CCNU0014 TaxID=3082949 RepID=UPI00384ED12F
MSTTFTIISLGARGVGKTMFLAYNCAEILRSSPKKGSTENLWFECADKEAQEKIEKLVEYIIRTGNYPPPTFKIEDFVFSLKGKGLKADKTLCQFRWSDLPGEWCNSQNPEFQSVLLKSHGCCVFVDVHAILNDESYQKTVETMMNQVEAIASLANKNNLKYPFSLICTKCDLVDLSPVGLIQIEEKLLPILSRLEAVKANFRRFYSPIHTLDSPKNGILDFKNAKVPLLWLITELQKLHGSDVQLDLGNSLNRAISSSLNDSTNDSTKIPSGNNLPVYSSKSFLNWKTLRSQKTVLAILLGCGVLSAILALFLNLDIFRPKTAEATAKQKIQQYEDVLQIDASNRDAITQIVDAYLELGQPDRAITRLEKLIETSPKDINTLFELAGLYTLTGQDDKEENTYDKILSQDGNNVMALVGKASIRKKKNDLKTAKALFEKAEKIAPTKKSKETINSISNLGNK